MSEILGRHVILDLYGVDPELLDDTTLIEKTLVRAAKICKATVLGKNFHEFKPEGVTGVLLLAESHISIHTFPEYNYAAIDIFMCYDCAPEDCISFLTKVFSPKDFSCTTLKRTV